MKIYQGTITLKERCEDYNCHHIKNMNVACLIEFDGTLAKAFDVTYPMKQFQWGETKGFHGKTEGNTLTLFFKGSKLKQAFILNYETAQKYTRWTCEF